MQEKKRYKREKLTNEERKFAEQNHDLLYSIMHSENISIDEFYDVAAYGYLKAVIKYHRHPELRKYCFSTIARQSIRCYVYNEIDARRRYSVHIQFSLDNVLNDEDTNCYSKFFAANKDSIKDYMTHIDLLYLLSLIMPYLSSDQRIQLACLLDGYKPKDLRLKKKDKTYDAYYRDMDVITKVVLAVLNKM